MDSSDVTAATAECSAYLRTAVEADWSVSIPGMDWTIGQAVAHICDGLIWYATDFAAGPVELSTTDLAVRPTTAPADLVRTLETFADVLVRVLDTAAPDARGWHPAGLPDASGFAGMACDELLVHTADAAAGLGHPFEPSSGLAERTVRRLFPEAPEDQDPWATLLWANGRRELGDLPRRTKWQWSPSAVEAP
jgi:uncharacterized protein (TIGR03083 family)